MREEDFVTIFLTANTHDDLLFFTDKGKAFQIKMYDIPEGKRATRGKSIMNFLALGPEDKITSILALPKEIKSVKFSLMMLTRDGVAKKVSADSFKDVRRSGLIAIKLVNGDELLAVRPVDKGDEIMMSSQLGQSIRFKESDIREMGRNAVGVRGMKLKKGDKIVGAEVVKKEQTIGDYLVMSENGYGKRTKLKEYKIQKRGGSGIKTMSVTKKTGQLVAVHINDGTEEEVFAISKMGQVIRTKIAEISVLGRATQGVRVMKLRPGDSLASLTCL